MSGKTPRETPDAEQYAKEAAKDAHEHFFNSSGQFKRRDINHVLASLADGAYSGLGTIKTTQHDEKVILVWDDSNDFYELGSYEVELSGEAMSVERLDSEERIEALTEWILNTSESIRREAESVSYSV